MSKAPHSVKIFGVYQNVLIKRGAASGNQIQDVLESFLLSVTASDQDLAA
jgi:hypothetical protein